MGFGLDRSMVVVGSGENYVRKSEQVGFGMSCELFQRGDFLSGDFSFFAIVGGFKYFSLVVNIKGLVIQVEVWNIW